MFVQPWMLWAAGVFLLLVLLQVIVRAKKPVLKAIGGILQGILTLVIVNLAGGFTGVTLPVSLMTLGVSGVAGIPGVTMLLLISLIMK